MYCSFVFSLCCVWWPGTAINVSVQYNGGNILDIILLTQGYYLWGTHSALKCHEEVVFLGYETTTLYT